MVSFADIKHGFEIGKDRVAFYLRLDMSLFRFSKEQTLRCIELLQNEVLSPVLDNCIIYCHGGDNARIERAINPRKVAVDAARSFESQNKSIESSYGFCFFGRVKTETIRLKKEIQTAIREEILSSRVSSPSVFCRYYDKKTDKLMHIPSKPDFNSATREDKRIFFDAAFEYANTDKYPVGNLTTNWEIDGMFTAVEMINKASGMLESVGDLKLCIAFPCIAHDLYGFFSLFKDLALKIHGIIPFSYGSVELGDVNDENYESIYNCPTSTAFDRFHERVETYRYLGSFNIITEKMYKLINNPDKVLSYKLPDGGAVIECLDNPFSLASLKEVRSTLEPVLSRGLCEDILWLFGIPSILPIPREDFVEVNLFDHLEPVILKA